MTANPSSEPPAPGPAPAPLSPSDERTWAMLAHFSVLLNLVTGFLGVVVPLVIYLIYKDRSRYLAYQSLQAFVFQLGTWVGGGALVGLAWAVTGILSTVLVGLLCIPFACVLSFLPLAALVYGVIGGLRCAEGQDFQYWLVGDWLRGALTA